MLACFSLASILLPFAEDAHGWKVLAADKGKVAVVDASGAVQWEFPTRAEVHDLWMLSNGNVLLPLGPATIAEVTPTKQIAWKYDCKPKLGYTGRIEVHAFQPLGDGNVMIAESGNARIVEINRIGAITKEIALKVDHPNPHRDTRMARKLKNGHYLVCHEADGAVREYDSDGKVVWEYKLDLGGRPRASGHGVEGHGTEIYGAVRLANGNTLIAGGNNNRVLEVSPKGEIVWRLDQNELSGVQLAWVTQLHALPNGNVVVGNCHAGESNPQLFEVTRDKKVVWTFKNFTIFGNGLAASLLLDAPAGTIR